MMGSWLVDLARHQGHLVGRSDPRSASLQVLAILKAAVDVDPNCADAYYWLYDLETRLGRTDAATTALKKYVLLAPDDEAARLRLFEIELSHRQTAEDRVEFIESQLALPRLSRIFESELHGRLARQRFERRENGAAAKSVEKSLRLNPMNITARRVAYDMFGETEPSLQRVEMALQMISANPGQTNLVWDLGEFLDRLGLHVQAQEWYNRAIRLHRDADVGVIPAEYWYKLAVSFLNSRDFPKCIEAADQALKVDANLYPARLLRATAFRRSDREKDADDEMSGLRSAYEARLNEAIESKNHLLIAEIAWFFAFHQPDAEKALRLSTAAMADPQPSMLARLAHGCALRLSGRSDEALQALKPLAGVDQIAAYETARILLDQDKKSDALAMLHKAAALQHDGIAYDFIADLLKQNGESPPVAPRHTRICNAVERFNRDVFDYIQRPADFLNVSMRFADDVAPAVGPIRVTFRMENVGPFAVTLGEGFMSRPLIAVSAKINGSGSRAFDNYLQVLLNTKPVLFPGDVVEKTAAINVGPIQQALHQLSAEPRQLRLLAVFDPVLNDGRLSAGVGSIQLREINTTLPPIPCHDEGISRLVAIAASAFPAERARAADEIGALLAAYEAADGAGPTAELNVRLLHAEMARLLNDESALVRAHALVAAGWSTLEPRVIAVAASPRVRSEEAVVRMLAVRLFAQQHGEKFRKVLEKMAESDEADFVRMMAAGYLPEDFRAAAQTRGAGK